MKSEEPEWTTEIRQLHESIRTALEAGALESAIAQYDRNAIQVNERGEIESGPSALQKAFHAMLGGQTRATKMRLGPGQVRALGANHAVWDGGFEVFPQFGNHIVHGHLYNVLAKADGRWRIIETHPRVFPCPTMET